jgi:hypothetical protein
MPICTCPLGAEISDITIPSCPEYLGQIQKVIFQRTYSSGSTENKFVVASTDPASLRPGQPSLQRVTQRKRS